MSGVVRALFFDLPPSGGRGSGWKRGVNHAVRFVFPEIPVDAVDASAYVEDDRLHIIVPGAAWGGAGTAKYVVPHTHRLVRDDFGVRVMNNDEFCELYETAYAAPPMPAGCTFADHYLRRHRSDCAQHNEPAEPNGPCDCGAENPTVDGPAHYMWHPSRTECKDIAGEFSYNVGTAIAYLWRHGRKGDAVEDLKKAAKHIEFEILRLQRKKS